MLCPRASLVGWDLVDGGDLWSTVVEEVYGSVYSVFLVCVLVVHCPCSLIRRIIL